MCFDEQTSWTTFIIGTLSNLFIAFKYQNNRGVFGMTFFWQYVLLVQFCEAIIHRSLRINKQNQCTVASSAIFYIILTQPIVLALVAAYIYEKQSLAGIIIAIYVLVTIYLSQGVQVDECMKPTKECKHIRYKWWEDLPKQRYAYYISVISIFLFIFSNSLPSLLIGGYLAGTFWISQLFYTCAYGSIWCWFAALAPIYTAIVLG